jgi:glutamate-1-semialdehyde 2,1-aminomutase
MTELTASTASQQLYEEACRYIPGGSSHVHYFHEPHPIQATARAGCRLDGVERLDFVDKMTSLIHGHAHALPPRA